MVRIYILQNTCDGDAMPLLAIAIWRLEQCIVNIMIRWSHSHLRWPTSSAWFARVCDIEEHRAVPEQKPGRRHGEGWHPGKGETWPCLRIAWTAEVKMKIWDGRGKRQETSDVGRFCSCRFRPACPAMPSLSVVAADWLRIDSSSLNGLLNCDFNSPSTSTSTHLAVSTASAVRWHVQFNNFPGRRRLQSTSHPTCCPKLEHS